MKLFFILLCSAFLFGFSTSESDNFIVKNGQVIWQKIYDTNLTKKQLVEAIKTSGYFEDVTIVNEKKMTAKINQLSPDHKAYGLSHLSTPSLISDNNIKAFVIIEFKDKQYRVTLKSIKLIDNLHDTNFSGSILMDIELAILNKKHTTFRDYFFKKSSKILDFTFRKITDFNKMIEDDTW